MSELLSRNSAMPADIDLCYNISLLFLNIRPEKVGLSKYNTLIRILKYRNKMKKVLMPEANRKDIDELPREVKTQIEFIFTGSVLEALLILFPEPFSVRS